MSKKIMYQVSFDAVVGEDDNYFFFKTEAETMNFIKICIEQNKKIIVEPYDEEMWEESNGFEK